jgi:hypothetical protein
LVIWEKKKEKKITKKEKTKVPFEIKNWTTQV